MENKHKFVNSAHFMLVTMVTKYGITNVMHIGEGLTLRVFLVSPW